MLSVIFKCSLVTVDDIFAGVAELSWIYLELASAVEGLVVVLSRTSFPQTLHSF